MKNPPKPPKSRILNQTKSKTYQSEVDNTTTPPKSKISKYEVLEDLANAIKKLDKAINDQLEAIDTKPKDYREIIGNRAVDIFVATKEIQRIYLKIAGNEIK